MINLRKLFPHAKLDLDALSVWLETYFTMYNIKDKCDFIANAAHETDGFNTFIEYASGRAYEHRHDLGNVNNGDGVLFKGRGIFMTTGRYNYMLKGKQMGVDLIAQPQLLQQPKYAAWSACIFWAEHKLDGMPFEQKVKRINGGLNGLQSRLKYKQLCSSYKF